MQLHILKKGEPILTRNFKLYFSSETISPILKIFVSNYSLLFGIYNYIISKRWTDFNTRL